MTLVITFVYYIDPPPDRPRAPKRYLIKADEVLRQEKEAEELRLAEEEAKRKKEAAKYVLLVICDE